MGFWDTDIKSLDFNKHRDFIIVRVFERGDDHDIDEIIKYYQRPLIKKALTSEKQLLPRAASVSYTHLDVYKRQKYSDCRFFPPLKESFPQSIDGFTQVTR